LKRVDGAGVEVVVSVLAVIEMKAGQLVELDQPRNNHLYVNGRSMMAKVNEAFCLLAQLTCTDVIGTPVLHHSRIKSRLVELVFDEYFPVLRQRRIYLAHAVQVTFETGREVLLPRKICAISNPHSQGF